MTVDKKDEEEYDVPAGFVPTADDFNAGVRMLGGAVHTAMVNGQLVKGRIVKNMFIPEESAREALAEAADEARSALGLD